MLRKTLKFIYDFLCIISIVICVFFIMVFGELYQETSETICIGIALFWGLLIAVNPMFWKKE